MLFRAKPRLSPIYLVAIAAAIAIITTVGCRQQRIEREIARINIEKVRISRFEEALFTLPDNPVEFNNGLKSIQPSFSVFLDGDLETEDYVSQIRNFVADTSNRNAFKAVMSHYPDLSEPERKLTDAFRHIVFYFPEWVPPRVYSYVSGYTPDNPVAYNGLELIIALDMYLGDEFPAYTRMGFPLYRVQRMHREAIVADCIREISNSDFISTVPYDHLLDKMIKEGKALYLADLFIPSEPDHLKIGFTKEQLQWCQEHEKQMWIYLIENQLFYESNPVKINRFIQEGPFTSVFSRESPAKAVIWLGWEMVRSFVKKNPSIPLNEMLLMDDARMFLSMSGYKP